MLNKNYRLRFNILLNTTSDIFYDKTHSYSQCISFITVKCDQTLFFFSGGPIISLISQIWCHSIRPLIKVIFVC